MTDAAWTEPGRHVEADGRIVYAWPPQGRYAVLWTRFDGAFDDEAKHDLLSLLASWRHESGTLVAYTNDAGEWVDVEPDWSVVEGWTE